VLESVKRTRTATDSETVVEGHDILAATGRSQNGWYWLGQSGVETTDHGYVKVPKTPGNNGARCGAVGEGEGRPAISSIIASRLPHRERDIHRRPSSDHGRQVPSACSRTPEFARIRRAKTKKEANARGMPIDSPKSLVADCETRTIQRPGFMESHHRSKERSHPWLPSSAFEWRRKSMASCKSR